MSWPDGCGHSRLTRECAMISIGSLARPPTICRRSPTPGGFLPLAVASGVGLVTQFEPVRGVAGLEVLRV
jgi:hypothetical protein